MRVTTFRVIIAQKTTECDLCLRIMKSVELRTFALWKRIVTGKHLVRFRHFRDVASEHQSEMTEIKCQKLRVADREGQMYSAWDLKHTPEMSMQVSRYERGMHLYRNGGVHLTGP